MITIQYTSLHNPVGLFCGGAHTCINVPVSNSLWPLNKSTDNAFGQGWPQPKVKYSQIPARRWPVYSSVYCLIFKFVAPSRRYLWNQYFLRSRLTLCKCVVSAFIQRSWQIWNWTICVVNYNSYCRAVAHTEMSLIHLVDRLWAQLRTLQSTWHVLAVLLLKTVLCVQDWNILLL